MAYKPLLDIDDIEKLDEIRNKESNTKILKRVLCIQLKHNGMMNQDIAGVLSISQNTVTNWIKTFNEKNLDGLLKVQ